MFCSYCGKEIKDGSKFCIYCGREQKVGVPHEPETIYQPTEIYAPPVSEQPPVYQQQPEYAPNNYEVPEKSGKTSAAVIIAIVFSCLSVIIVCATLIFTVMNKKSDKIENDSGSKASVSNVDPKKDNDDPDAKDSAGENSAQGSTAPEKPEPDDEPLDDSYESILSKALELENLEINYVSSDVSDYPNVKVYFTVKDMYGNNVTLNSPYFAIKEQLSSGEMLEREVKSFERLDGREGVSFDLVADKSASMSGDMPSMQSIMTSFVDALDYATGDRAELISFDTYVMYMCTYTQDTSLLKNGIANMTTYGDTALYDALYEALLNSGFQKGARCIIAFTDGQDNQSVHTAQEVIDLANTYSVPIFIVGTYSGDWSVYSDISLKTGGNYWSIDSIYDLTDILDWIYSEEKDMYCLEYVSDSDLDAYSERSISCVVYDKSYGSESEANFTPTETIEEKSHSSRYEVIKGAVSWQEANAECIKRGGHLITITSADEMKKAYKLAEKNGLDYVWMGGYTSVSGGGAYGHWITGEPFEYEKWFDGEPSRTDHDGIDEMYLMLWKIKGEWSWNDQRNDPAADYDYFKDSNMGYICEYED